jgi:hypothetical protein
MAAAEQFAADEDRVVVRRAQAGSLGLALLIAAICVAVVWQAPSAAPPRASASRIVAYCLAFGVLIAGLGYVLLTQSYRRRTARWVARVAANDPLAVPALPTGATFGVPCARCTADGRRHSGMLYLVPVGLLFQPHISRPMLLPFGRRGSPDARPLPIGPAALIELAIGPVESRGLARLLWPGDTNALLVRAGEGDTVAFIAPSAFQAERRLRAALAELLRSDASRQRIAREADEHADG